MSNIENFYVSHYNKIAFFKEVEAAEIDIEKTSIKQKQYNEHYFKFNILLDRLKSNNSIKLFDICMYLFEDYFDKVADVMACFDEYNQSLLKEEAAIAYHIPYGKSLLENFLFK